MIDITGKPVVYREATASGKIFLKKDTIEKIKTGKIKKGNPLEVAQIAAINAAKQTHQIIPLCHQLLLTSVAVDFKINDDCVEATCTVKVDSKTGVEMEALVGVSIALNTIWDMTKYLEKDENGQYVSTKIEGIRVLNKIKGKVNDI